MLCVVYIYTWFFSFTVKLIVLQCSTDSLKPGFCFTTIKLQSIIPNLYLFYNYIKSFSKGSSVGHGAAFHFVTQAARAPIGPHSRLTECNVYLSKLLTVVLIKIYSLPLFVICGTLDYLWKISIYIFAGVLFCRINVSVNNLPFCNMLSKR